MLLRTIRLILILFLLIVGPAGSPDQVIRSSGHQVITSAWAEEALKKEAGYIVNCSFTEFTKNKKEVQEADDAYGALNVNRVYQRGPDWVVPGEGAMGAIGLMAAAAHLNAGGMDTTPYERVLDRYFRTWLMARKQPVDTDEVSPNHGGCFERVYYDQSGRRLKEGHVRTGATGQMIAAMWKFYEFKQAIGDTRGAGLWLEQSWPLASRGGEFIRRCYSPSQRLVRSDSRGSEFWISDSTYSAMALRCLARWVVVAEKTPAFDYDGLANQIVRGIQAMKDGRTRKSFFRLRGGRRQSYRPTYGDRIDQLCFLPYEADVLDPGEPFARAISDWWTNGSGGIRMTFQTNDPGNWRYFGTRWRYYFRGPAASKREYLNLFPGPGLQLAKMEWKHARKAGDKVTLERARRRFEWAHSAGYSNLWLGADGRAEGEVPNGLVDWRNSTRRAHKAEEWNRFVDTSAYFIEVLLMLQYGKDTRYIPDEKSLSPKGPEALLQPGQ